MDKEKTNKLRVRKTNEQRLEEILDTCEKLFYEKGYNDTTIIDIIDAVGIAKGTFYYYFKSKEEIMNAVIKRYVEQECAKLHVILTTDGGVYEKIRTIFYTTCIEQNNVRKMRLLQVVHSSDAEFHIRSMAESIGGLVPIMYKLIMQGIEEGKFKTEHPLTVAQYIIAGFQFLFDDILYPSTLEETVARFCDFVDLCEDMLGSPRGSLKFLFDIYSAGFQSAGSL